MMIMMQFPRSHTNPYRLGDFKVNINSETRCVWHAKTLKTVNKDKNSLFLLICFVYLFITRVEKFRRFYKHWEGFSKKKIYNI